jgi:hypothetical protein
MPRNEMFAWCIEDIPKERVANMGHEAPKSNKDKSLVLVRVALVKVFGNGNKGMLCKTTERVRCYFLQ